MIIKDFSVKNFRCLRYLALRKLKRINVIVGRNNTGKTTLLEALFFHAATNHPTMAFNLRTHRGFSGELSVSKLDLTELWRDLFYAFEINSVIELESEDSTGRKRRSVIWVGKEGSKQLDIPRVDGAVALGRTAPLTVEYTDPTGQTRTSSLVLGKSGLQVEDPSAVLDYFGIILPSYFRVPQEEEAERLEKVIREKRKAEVIKLVQVIEPRLVDMVVGLSTGNPIVLCDVGLSQLAPLPVLGEGTHKLVSIALALASARAGIVMVDEIENGIYYDSQQHFWLKLHQMAVKEDVQVFATTHSRECLEALQSAATQDPAFHSDVKLVRLAREDGEIHASEYEYEALQSALETGFEIR